MSSKSSFDTPAKRRSLRKAQNLEEGEENMYVSCINNVFDIKNCFRTFKGQVLFMEDQLHFDKSRKIRTLILSDGSSFIHLSAWDQARSLFATLTSSDVNASASAQENASAFKHLLVKLFITIYQLICLQQKNLKNHF